MKACWNDHSDIVSLLVKHGANVNLHDEVSSIRFYTSQPIFQNNETALLKASWGGYFKIVSFLIDHGADVNTQNNVQQNP